MDNPKAETGGRRQGGKVSSNFSATCRRLSQYLREKGSLGALSVSMAGAIDPRRIEGKPEALRTLNLLPGEEAPPRAASNPGTEHIVEKKILPRRPVLPDLNRQQKLAQMTIFYGGKAVVFNNFSEENARELVYMAGQVCSPVEQPASEPSRQPDGQPPAPAGAVAVDASASPAVPLKECPQQPAAPASSDMPIARNVSLHRFLEKRKDRIIARAPYQVKVSGGAPGSSSSPPAKGDGELRPWWLGLAPQATGAGEGSAVRHQNSAASDSDTSRAEGCDGAAEMAGVTQTRRPR